MIQRGQLCVPPGMLLSMNAAIIIQETSRTLFNISAFINFKNERRHSLALTQEPANEVELMSVATMSFEMCNNGKRRVHRIHLY
jgi:hypothetical protein